MNCVHSKKYVKDIVDSNDNIIEIVSSNSALELLKRSGNKNIKISLPLSLCIDEITKTKPFTRDICGVTYDFNNDFKELNDISKNCKKIRVWSSHLDSDDYCLFLLICYLYQDKEISVIFTEELNFGATTICSVRESEIKELEKREHILTKQEKEDYANEWENVVKSNKEIRYMINGTVVSCDFANFENKIIDRLEKNRKIPISKFIADLILNPVIPRVIFSDFIYTYLLERLEKVGKIKSYIIDDKKYIELI